MGVSGAGKTTLLDILAHQTSIGIFSGKTGYVQQQDLHLETATVRETLRFSALLGQPATVSMKSKYDYVENVNSYASHGGLCRSNCWCSCKGFNVEQSKLSIIGVELAAKPKLLLFLDEPTSGLNSQGSWAICSFLQFNQSLLLARGGKTVYFGPIGEQSRTLLEYSEYNGARKCDDNENPAEYMIDVQSQKSAAVQIEIDRIHQERQEASMDDDCSASQSEFAMPTRFQLCQVTYRVFQQYWRMPSYILSKWGLGVAAGLLIGFSFYQAKASLQGMQTVVYSVFMVCTIFTLLFQQLMPLFVTQQSLFEVREKPSKAYSWKVFRITKIIVEIPYMVLTGVLIYACYYYAVVGIPSSPPSALPDIWIFIYPMTATLVHSREIVCSAAETLSLRPSLR
ncbi:uncharacterized protein BP01DRAFT_373782 [Aspergillus saccharolyticus JOP 1030-1]|uniref:ABC-2 type transporter transmembrane domain-containing protein n=1 Tax=Aspergillus saccharolyticus JOP 1030-1 TaxID=1450539 RepID=A0A319AFE3_9EURO|nr:hypothetical protein BP01DRAFT_373782 [Aspergillus saccharolyticus JOP 1030-1]PYH45512.1 hypothetical protein BP01DRAFT_373782 [Aspergillus saccharolyticus JOP 1030-1]